MSWFWIKVLGFVSLLAMADYFMEWSPPARVCQAKGGTYDLGGHCTKFTSTAL